jgi:hypothetical protein
MKVYEAKSIAYMNSMNNKSHFSFFIETTVS